MNRIIPILLTGLLLFSSFGAVAYYDLKPIDSQETKYNNKIETWRYTISSSYPEINEHGEYVKVQVEGANSFLTNPEYPMLPYHSIVTTFPLGTKIIDVKCIHSTPKNIHLNKKLLPALEAQWLDKDIYEEKNNMNHLIHNNEKSYFNNWYNYRTGGGIDNGGHVTFLSIHFYPVRYNANENILQFVEYAELEVNYVKPIQSLVNNEEFSLVIITPSVFTGTLQPLVDHKNEHDISTNLVTLDDIYSGNYFPVKGGDDAEKIKYFIRDTIEQWGTDYILLVGSVHKLPIRKTLIGDDNDLLSDLYYADIYSSDGGFCSWDSNGNGLYGEYRHNGETDTVDLYPDVYIGRLACDNDMIVRIVVDKIINYEEKTYGEDWFNNIILCGGDTFPGHGVYEGEVTNDEVAKTVPELTPIKLRTSEGTYSPSSINKAITNGAGFLEYSGHGYEFGFGTSPPNDDNRTQYYTPSIIGMLNDYKLPIIFFDACLTARLDFTLADLLGLNIFGSNTLFPCFAWCLVLKPGGGAIATVGATREAYTMVDETGVHGGAGYLSVHFFKAYNKGRPLGEMLVQSKNDYLNNLWLDPFTLEEFVLLGDPTLKVGGYDEN